MSTSISSSINNTTSSSNIASASIAARIDQNITTTSPFALANDELELYRFWLEATCSAAEFAEQLRKLEAESCPASVALSMAILKYFVDSQITEEQRVRFKLYTEKYEIERALEDAAQLKEELEEISEVLQTQRKDAMEESYCGWEQLRKENMKTSKHRQVKDWIINRGNGTQIPIYI